MRVPLQAMAMVLLVLHAGCGRPEAEAKDLDSATGEFKIYWPPKDPEQAAGKTARPLLNGSLHVGVQDGPSGIAAVRLQITLVRPSDETGREYWNSTLAYSNVAWMEEVRVWDDQHKWLWPNLPYLLRLPGRERVDRYGGLDPGKGVDNDFAAVLIRKFDGDGKVESADTKAHPLVSAEWHPVSASPCDRFTIVHAARSDEFLLHLGDESRSAHGRIKVWLIYADFLWSLPPRTWPKQKEFAGGILSYLEVDWTTSPGKPCQGAVRVNRPEASTGFDWQRWVVRAPGADHSESQIRLSDVDTK